MVSTGQLMVRDFALLIRMEVTLAKGERSFFLYLGVLASLRFLFLSFGGGKQQPSNSLRLTSWISPPRDIVRVTDHDGPRGYFVALFLLSEYQPNSDQ